MGKSIPYREGFTEPVDLGEGFRLHKDRCGQQLEAICWLRTHPLGWELVLNINGNLQRSEVCRSQERAPLNISIAASRAGGEPQERQEHDAGR